MLAQQFLQPKLSWRRHSCAL